MVSKIKEIDSKMGKESAFPRATETYRNYSQELRDGSYSNQTLKQLESGFLKDFAVTSPWLRRVWNGSMVDT